MHIDVLIAVALLTGLGLGVLLIRHRWSLEKAAREKAKAAEELPEDQVQCFSCGMVVPKEKALEKKGRYFCGVKRNDRNGRPVQRDESRP